MANDAAGVVALARSEAVTETHWSAFMRYNGQGHEIEIPLPNRTLGEYDVGPLIAAFETEYSKQFSRPVPGMEIEILNWAVRVTTPQKRPAPMPQATVTRSIKTEHEHIIYCDVDGIRKPAMLVERSSLEPGDRFNGPALVTEPQTTTLVSADFAVQVDQLGNLVLTRNHFGEV